MVTAAAKPRPTNGSSVWWPPLASHRAPGIGCSVSDRPSKPACSSARATSSSAPASSMSSSVPVISGYAKKNCIVRPTGSQRGAVLRLRTVPRPGHRRRRAVSVRDEPKVKNVAPCGVLPASPAVAAQRDGERQVVAREGDEAQLLEPALGEEAPQLGDSCRSPRGEGPHDAAARTAKPPQELDRALLVVVVEVPEQPGDDDEVGGREAVVRVGLRGVPVDDLEPREPGVVRPSTGDGRVVRVELDEPPAHVTAPRMVLERTDDLAPLAAADAHDGDEPGRGLVDDRGDVCPHGAEPPGQLGPGIVVALVPLVPVGEARVRHAGHARRRSLGSMMAGAA